MTDSGLTYDLKDGFRLKQASLLSEMEMVQTVGHSVQVGNNTEDKWERVLRDFLPQRYGVATSHIIIDSDGHKSEQIDIVVYDRQFAPSFLKLETAEVIPVESVYAVFEVKQALNLDKLRAAAAKAESVRRLVRHPGGFRTVQGEAAHALEDIIGGILCSRADWSPAFGRPFETAMADTDKLARLDLGCVLREGAFDYSPGAETQAIRISEAAYALGAFSMALFRRLQKFGNAAAIDPDRYARELWVSTSD